MACTGKVALVTGASRGIGNGIARGLAKEGAIVIITGRRKNATRALDSITPGIVEAAAEINKSAVAGGCCRAAYCDHAKDEEVQKVFDDIFIKEGRLDILVNNAFSGLDSNGGDLSGTFWDKPLSTWDEYHTVGLRSHYICSALAARRWVKDGTKGLIVNISSAAGFGYVWDVAYGVGKCGVDRLTADTAKELKGHGVNVICMWPGAVHTPAVEKNLKAGTGLNLETFNVAEMESTELSGRCVVALASDPNIQRFTGKILFNYEICEEYGITDIDGRVKYGVDNSFKQLRGAMKAPPRHWQVKLDKKRGVPQAKL